MNDVKTWRVLCSHWNTSPYDLECGLRAACDRIEALERENAALLVRLIGPFNCAMNTLIPCDNCAWCESTHDDREALAALASPKAPATSKETP